MFLHTEPDRTEFAELFIVEPTEGGGECTAGEIRERGSTNPWSEEAARHQTGPRRPHGP